MTDFEISNLSTDAESRLILSVVLEEDFESGCVAETFTSFTDSKYSFSLSTLSSKESASLYSAFDNYKEDINKSRILNKEIYPHDDNFTHIEEEIESTLSWINNRINWISEQLKNETSVNVINKDIDSIKSRFGFKGEPNVSKDENVSLNNASVIKGNIHYYYGKERGRNPSHW